MKESTSLPKRRKGGLTDDDLVEEFDSLVRSAMADKREKLRHVSLPKVLLLIDNYYLRTTLLISSRGAPKLINGQRVRPAAFR